MAMNTARRIALTTGLAALSASIASAAIAGSKEGLNWLLWQLSYLLPSGVVGAAFFLLLGIAASVYVSIFAYWIANIWTKRK